MPHVTKTERQKIQRSQTEDKGPKKANVSLRQVLFWMVEKEFYLDRDGSIKFFDFQPSKLKLMLVL